MKVNSNFKCVHCLKFEEMSSAMELLHRTKLIWVVNTKKSWLKFLFIFYIAVRKHSLQYLAKHRHFRGMDGKREREKEVCCVGAEMMMNSFERERRNDEERKKERKNKRQKQKKKASW